VNPVAVTVMSSPPLNGPFGVNVTDGAACAACGAAKPITTVPAAVKNKAAPMAAAFFMVFIRNDPFTLTLCLTQ
jgi:hypothetical protein